MWCNDGSQLKLDPASNLSFLTFKDQQGNSFKYVSKHFIYYLVIFSECPLTVCVCEGVYESILWESLHANIPFVHDKPYHLCYPIV